MTKNGHLLIDFLSYKQKNETSRSLSKTMAYFKVILKDLGPPLKPFQFNELIMYHTLLTQSCFSFNDPPH